MTSPQTTTPIPCTVGMLAWNSGETLAWTLKRAKRFFDREVIYTRLDSDIARQHDILFVVKTAKSYF